MSTDIVSAVTASPQLVLLDKDKAAELLAHISAEVDAHVTDLTTEKGRKATASFAFKIVRTKTAIDEAGAKMVEEISTGRKAMREALDGLRDRARKSLTEWEEAEKKRVERCNNVISRLQSAAILSLGITSEEAEKRLADVQSFTIDEAEFGNLFQQAIQAKDATVITLQNGIAQLKEAEEARRLAALQAKELAGLKAQQEKDRLAALAAMPDSEIDTSDIPEADEQAFQRARLQLPNSPAPVAEDPPEATMPAKSPEDPPPLRETAGGSKLDPPATPPAYAKGSGSAGSIAGYTRKDTLQYVSEAIAIECGVDHQLAARIALALVCKQIPNIQVQL